MQMSYLRPHAITGNSIGISVLLLAGDMRDLDSSQASLGSGSRRKPRCFHDEYISPCHNSQFKTDRLARVMKKDFPRVASGDSHPGQLVTMPTKELTHSWSWCASAGRHVFHWSISAECKQSRLPPKQVNGQGAGLFCYSIG